MSPIDLSNRNATGSSSGFDSVPSSVTVGDDGSVTSILNDELDEEARYIEESMKRDIAASLGKTKSNSPIQSKSSDEVLGGVDLEEQGLQDQLSALKPPPSPGMFSGIIIYYAIMLSKLIPEKVQGPHMNTIRYSENH